jgi:uncharacterized membrane protein YciS (DUF1049 family)
MAILALILIFVFENVTSFTNTVDIRYNIYIYGFSTVKVPVWSLLFFMFGAGMVVTFFLELVGWFKLRTRIIKQKRSIKSLEKELSKHRLQSPETEMTNEG